MIVSTYILPTATSDFSSGRQKHNGRPNARLQRRNARLGPSNFSNL